MARAREVRGRCVCDLMGEVRKNVKCFCCLYIGLAFTEHAVARRKVPEAVVEAVGCFHEECRALDLESAPSARGGT